MYVYVSAEIPGQGHRYPYRPEWAATAEPISEQQQPRLQNTCDRLPLPLPQQCNESWWSKSAKTWASRPAGGYSVCQWPTPFRDIFILTDQASTWPFPRPLAAAAAVASVMSDSVQPHRRQPTRLRRLWDSPGKNTGVGCHFLLQLLYSKVNQLYIYIYPLFFVFPSHFSHNKVLSRVPWVIQ